MRSLSLQRFVGPNVVEEETPLVAGPLLRWSRASRQRLELFRHVSMHSLVAPVVL
jgi:hypothetical protein